MIVVCLSIDVSEKVAAVPRVATWQPSSSPPQVERRASTTMSKLPAVVTRYEPGGRSLSR